MMIDAGPIWIKCIFAEEINIIRMETLKEKLEMVKSSEGFINHMSNIAKSLLSEYQIRKGEKRYDILEIEFYYFDKDHPDIITYPRTAESGDWFFHQSGVDLCFKSVVVRNENTKDDGRQGTINPENSHFGGILIRAIRRGDGTLFLGPLNTCDELFDRLNAFGNNDDLMPLIEKRESAKPYEEKSYSRYFKFSSDSTKKKDTLSKGYMTYNNDIKLGICIEEKYRYSLLDEVEPVCKKLATYKRTVNLIDKPSLPAPKPL
jgi:hypothetical protein